MGTILRSGFIEWFYCSSCQLWSSGGVSGPETNWWWVLFPSRLIPQTHKSLSLHSTCSIGKLNHPVILVSSTAAVHSCLWANLITVNVAFNFL